MTDLSFFAAACEQALRRARDVMDAHEAPHRAEDREKAFWRVFEVLQAEMGKIKP